MFPDRAEFHPHCWVQSNLGLWKKKLPKRLPTIFMGRKQLDVILGCFKFCSLPFLSGEETRYQEPLWPRVLLLIITIRLTPMQTRISLFPVSCKDSNYWVYDMQISNIIQLHLLTEHELQCNATSCTFPGSKCENSQYESYQGCRSVWCLFLTWAFYSGDWVCMSFSLL
jgi:hypothetical protein